MNAPPGFVCPPSSCSWPECDTAQCPYNDPRLAVMDAEALLTLDWSDPDA